jgi:spore coat protein U-like protein
MRISALLAASITTFGLASAAFAATDTDDLLVTATVAESCSITGDTLDFGTYAKQDADPLDVNATITVDCNSGADATISLSGGANEAGSSVTAPIRQMDEAGLGAAKLQYQLYSNGGRSIIWGGDTASVGYDALEQEMTVFGRIPAGQNVPTGSYSDTVVATITF